MDSFTKKVLSAMDDTVRWRKYVFSNAYVLKQLLSVFNNNLNFKLTE